MYESEDDRRSRRSRLGRIIQALERSLAVSYILDSGYRVIHCNPAWDNFAVRNGAPGLTGENVIGPNIFEAIPTVLKNFFFRCICAGVNAGHMGSVL